MASFKFYFEFMFYFHILLCIKLEIKNQDYFKYQPFFVGEVDLVFDVSNVLRHTIFVAYRFIYLLIFKSCFKQKLIALK